MVLLSQWQINGGDMSRELQIHAFKIRTGQQMAVPHITNIDDIVGRTTLYMNSPFCRTQRKGLFMAGVDRKEGWRALYGNLRPNIRKVVDALCGDLSPHALKVSNDATAWAIVSVEAVGLEQPVFLTAIYFDDYRRWVAKRMS